MNKRHPSGVFLMEMIAVVFFFIVCSSLCILVFAKADRLSQRAADLNQGVLIAQSVAEVWKDRGEEGFLKYFPNSQEAFGENSAVFSFGRDGSGVPAKEAVFTAVVTFGESGDTGRITVTVYGGKEEVFSLSADRHGEAGKEEAGHE